MLGRFTRMAKRKLKVGDKIRVTGYRPGKYALNGKGRGQPRLSTVRIGLHKKHHETRISEQEKSDTVQQQPAYRRLKSNRKAASQTCQINMM